LDVFVHEVIAAMVTAPWSRVNLVPSDSSTSTGVLGRPSAVAAADGWPAGGLDPLPEWDGASEAGKVPSTSSSYPWVSCSSVSPVST
jgi:hypothetical protein